MNYVGSPHVNVTGAEFLDQRWPTTPVLRIQSIDRIP